MQTVPFDYKKERSVISLKYGIDLDETSSSILFVLRHQQAVLYTAQNAKLDQAISKINTAANSLQVDSKGPRQQAFWFGMGQWGIALIFAISIAASLYIYYANEQVQNRKESLQLGWYKTYYNISLNGTKKEFADFLNKNPLPPK